MSDCLFCKIVAGEIPADKIFEDDEFVAFNDIRPQAPVHALVIHLRHCADAANSAPRVHISEASSEAHRGAWRVLASGRDTAPNGALPLRCDAELRVVSLQPGTSVTHVATEGRRLYAMACEGSLRVGDDELVNAGDRVLARGEGPLRLHAETAADVVLLDLG